MEELVDALKSNFEGCEDVRAMLRNAPCYGNNDPYADSIAKAIDRASLEFTRKYARELGGPPGSAPGCRSPPMCRSARWVSATPNGRKAYTALADGSSASHGADGQRPHRAVLLSNFCHRKTTTSGSGPPGCSTSN